MRLADTDTTPHSFCFLYPPTEDVVHQAYVTASATVPAPTFQISIPAELDFGILEQKTLTAEDRIAEMPFAVEAENVRYLFGKQLVVRIEPSVGDAFALQGSRGSRLPYAVYNLPSGGDALAVDSEFAVFAGNGRVDGRVAIDQSVIEIADTYSGTLIFSVSVTEASNS